MVHALARRLLRIGLRTLPAQFDRSNGSSFAMVLGAAAVMIVHAILFNLIAVGLAAILVGVACSGCADHHVRAPYVAPTNDAGAVTSDAPPSRRCAEWRLFENPEDVYCARWE